jgi:hypothetical protein
LAEVKGKSAKVTTLQTELDELKGSSASDMKNALDNLKTDLEAKHQEEMDNLIQTYESEISVLRKSHETQLSELKAALEAERAKLEDLSIYDELRMIKSEFEKSKREHERDLDKRIYDAANEAAAAAEAHTRAIMGDEIRSLQTSHTATLSTMHVQHQEELARLREESEAEKNKAVEQAIAEIKNETHEIKERASGDMKTLSDAHSAKTASLESEIAETKAAKQAAEEKAQKVVEYEHQLEEQSKELTDAKLELEEARKKIKSLKRAK